MADWSQTLPSGATILDLGCGTGVPISQALIERGFKVYCVDASPTIVAAFRVRFPNVPVQCADVEDSDFFARTFDGVVAWGLFFLLDTEVQRRLIKRVAGVLQSGGRLLFTAPTETDESGCFPDVMTGRPQFSLGYEEYRRALEAEGMFLVGTHRKPLLLGAQEVKLAKSGDSSHHGFICKFGLTQNRHGALGDFAFFKLISRCNAATDGLSGHHIFHHNAGMSESRDVT